MGSGERRASWDAVASALAKVIGQDWVRAQSRSLLVTPVSKAGDESKVETNDPKGALGMWP